MLASGPNNYNSQFTLAADGTIALSTTPFPIGGGTITGPVVIKTNTAPSLSAPPAGTLLQLGSADGSNTQLLVDTYGGTPVLNMRRANNTAAAPAAIALNDTLGQIGFFGYGASGYGSGSTVLRGVGTEAWTNTAQGAAFTVFTTPNGTTTVAERMRIDHNGNVGIGTTAPIGKLHVSANAAPMLALFETSADTDAKGWDFLGTTGVLQGRAVNDAYSTSSPWLAVYRTAATVTAVCFPTGNVGIGTTPVNKLTLAGQAAAGLGLSQWRSGPNGADSTTTLMQFADFGSTVQIGVIARTGTNQVAYGTSSDTRLKDDIRHSQRGLDTLMAIEVCDYRMGETQQQGLLAQQVAEHYPEAVIEGGDDPAMQPWMLDYGRFTPLIIRGMQQQQARIEALENMVMKGSA